MKPGPAAEAVAMVSVAAKSSASFCRQLARICLYLLRQNQCDVGRKIAELSLAWYFYQDLLGRWYFRSEAADKNFVQPFGLTQM